MTLKSAHPQASLDDHKEQIGELEEQRRRRRRMGALTVTQHFVLTVSTNVLICPKFCPFTLDASYSRLFHRWTPRKVVPPAPPKLPLHVALKGFHS